MIKVLVDSSAWIHFFNHSSPKHHEAVLKCLADDRVVTCGPILTEVLRGARNQREKKSLIEHFSILEFYDFEKKDYFQTADLGLALRSKGLNVKTIDLLIAHLAMREKLLLLHHDRDFEMIASHTVLMMMKVEE